jgi:hypothetical protein
MASASVELGGDLRAVQVSDYVGLAVIPCQVRKMLILSVCAKRNCSQGTVAQFKWKILHAPFDQIQNLQNCCTTPNKNTSKDDI